MDMDSLDVVRLAELLQEPSNSGSGSDDEDSQHVVAASRLGPADLARHVQTFNSVVETRPPSEEDVRLRPDVEFAYSQVVGTEDLYLGLGLRNPGTASCEHLRVTLSMPQEDAAVSEIDAQVDSERNCLELTSPRYRLSLPLPQPVDQRSSLHRAQWDPAARQLVVTVRLCRELDCVNF